MAEPLKNKDFFKNVEIIQDGRIFGWANNYDCCADWARYYAKDIENEWDGFEDSGSLKQRILIAEQKIKTNSSAKALPLSNVSGEVLPRKRIVSYKLKYRKL